MKKAFTLIELLVVIAIIGLLSTIVLASLNSAREKANISNMVSQFKEIEKALNLYYLQTGEWPPNCTYNCTALSDPFLVNVNSLPGWNGPYLTNFYQMSGPYGGKIGLITSADYDGDSVLDVGIQFDDDAPGTSSIDNSAAKTTEQLEAIDEILDDGDLTTGKFRGYGSEETPDANVFLRYRAASGEGVFLYSSQ